MFLSLIASFFISAPATAQTVYAVSQTQKLTFSVWDSTGAGNHTYFSCDGLEDLTKSLLLQLGAQKIKVRCSGGLDSTGYWGSPLVRAEFIAPMVSEQSTNTLATYHLVSLKGRDNCSAAQTIFSAISKKMDVTVHKGQNNFCESRQSYQIEAKTLFFEN